MAFNDDEEKFDIGKEEVEDQKTCPTVEFLEDIENEQTQEGINSQEFEILEILREEEKDSSHNDEDSDDSAWYPEEDAVLTFGNGQHVESDGNDLDWDISFGNTKSEDDFIGDFVKIEFPHAQDSNSVGDVDLSRLEKLFDTSEIHTLKETLRQQNFEQPIETVNYDAPTEVDQEAPIVPDFEIDYDNIYENIENASLVEKHLQLLYRPFTCLVDVNCRFSLYELAILLDDARYEPAHHPALFVRLRNPSAEVKLYSGGKISSSALTAASARTALLKVIQMVEQLDYTTDITHFSKNSVHASFCLPFKVDLEMLSEMHSEHVSGNRETRPFITYKINGTAIRFAVFPNGYVLVLHSKQHSETRAAIAGFLPILAQFKNGYLTHSEKYGSLCGDVSFKLLWERKLEEDKEGALLYS